MSAPKDKRKAKPSDKYWADRSVERLTEAEEQSLPYLHKVQVVYREAAKATVEAVHEIYSAYYTRHGFERGRLDQVANNGDIKAFQVSMRETGLSTRLPKNYRGRMSRLELLNAQMWAEAKKAAIREGDLTTEAYRNTIKNGYYRTIYDVSKGTGTAPTFSILNTRTVDKILQTRFKGANYSKRIWGNTDHLANTLEEVLSTAIATGQPMAKTVQEIKKRFAVGTYAATRLVRTETNYFETMAELEACREMGIDRYQIIATLDNRTSDICRAEDHKIYFLKDAEQGKNAPPFHPNCRSTVAPYVSAEFVSDVRIARDPKSGQSYVTEDMDYKEWLKTITTARAGYQGKIIGGREHLRTIINAFINSGYQIPRRVAKIMTGEQNEVRVFTVNEEVAERLNAIPELESKVAPKMEVIIDLEHLKHLDNSGHLTGKPNRKGHAKDRNPLTAADFKAIPSIIKSPDVIKYAGRGRFGRKIKIEKIVANKKRLILEFVEKDGRFILATFYNITKKKR